MGVELQVARDVLSRLVVKAAQGRVRLPLDVFLITRSAVLAGDGDQVSVFRIHRASPSPARR
jgi:hypothetical protein